jgi:uncharacterized caspase-like protein
MRIAIAFACALFLIFFVLTPGHAEKRVALAVGNGDYQHADKLANPVTDARRMRDALGKLDFEIVYSENLGKQQLELEIGSFADAVQDADVALVYFAGHGATFGDVPYVSLGRMPYVLVPVETLRRLPVTRFLIDGEAVGSDQDGMSNFEHLHPWRAHSGRLL